jgi:hypothetical protein
MIDENATQSGSRPAVVFNEVEAVVQRLVKILHEHDSLGQICPRLPRSLFTNDQSFVVARRTLLNGDGVGEVRGQRWSSTRWKRSFNGWSLH